LNLFAACISGYQLPNDELQKPHPYMLKNILAELDMSPKYALYIGDSKTDIQMAKAADVIAVAVLTGNMSRADAESEESDVVLDSVTDLPDLIGLRPDFT
jgi:phosphoglycolate phosphatase-like HAD superfamily hydrolase